MRRLPDGNSSRRKPGKRRPQLFIGHSVGSRPIHRSLSVARELPRLLYRPLWTRIFRAVLAGPITHLSIHHLDLSLLSKLVQLGSETRWRHGNPLRDEVLLDLAYDVIIARLLQIGDDDGSNVFLRFATR